MSERVIIDPNTAEKILQRVIAGHPDIVFALTQDDLLVLSPGDPEVRAGDEPGRVEFVNRVDIYVCTKEVFVAALQGQGGTLKAQVESAPDRPLAVFLVPISGGNETLTLVRSLPAIKAIGDA